MVLSSRQVREIFPLCSWEATVKIVPVRLLFAVPIREFIFFELKLRICWCILTTILLCILIIYECCWCILITNFAGAF